MIREVDLLSYLPLFMQEFREIAATLNAENPEFNLIWEVADQVRRNEFISTADEYGIARFESILGILVCKEDDLEFRRSRVLTRWNNTLPYTLAALIEKLEILCGKSGFSVVKNYDCYELIIETFLELFGKVEELERLLTFMVPCNMVLTVRNNIVCNAEGDIWMAGAVRATEFFYVSNDFQEECIISGQAIIGSGVMVSEIIGA